MAAENTKPAEALSQADLSHLPLQQMSPAERAELKRRYDDFVRHFGAAGPPRAPLPAKPRVVKWVPGRRAKAS